VCGAGHLIYYDHLSASVSNAIAVSECKNPTGLGGAIWPFGNRIAPSSPVFVVCAARDVIAIADPTLVELPNEGQYKGCRLLAPAVTTLTLSSPALEPGFECPTSGCTIAFDGSVFCVTLPGEFFCQETPEYFTATTYPSPFYILCNSAATLRQANSGGLALVVRQRRSILDDTVQACDLVSNLVFRQTKAFMLCAHTRYDVVELLQIGEEGDVSVVPDAGPWTCSAMLTDTTPWKALALALHAATDSLVFLCEGTGLISHSMGPPVLPCIEFQGCGDMRPLVLSSSWTTDPVYFNCDNWLVGYSCSTGSVDYVYSGRAKIILPSFHDSTVYFVTVEDNGFLHARRADGSHWSSAVWVGCSQITQMLEVNHSVVIVTCGSNLGALAAINVETKSLNYLVQMEDCPFLNFLPWTSGRLMVLCPTGGVRVVHPSCDGLPGMHLVDGACVPCEANSQRRRNRLQFLSTNPTCWACEAGQFSAVGSPACAPPKVCPAGTYLKSPSEGTCHKCVRGMADERIEYSTL